MIFIVSTRTHLSHFSAMLTRSQNEEIWVSGLSWLSSSWLGLLSYQTKLAEEERRRKIRKLGNLQLQNLSLRNWDSGALWNSLFSCKYSNYQCHLPPVALVWAQTFQRASLDRTELFPNQQFLASYIFLPIDQLSLWGERCSKHPGNKDPILKSLFHPLTGVCTEGVGNNEASFGGWWYFYH